jgi:hypothetical protein
LAHDVGDGLDVLLEQADRVGIGHHDAGGFFVHDGGYGFRREDSSALEGTGTAGIAAERGAGCWCRAVSGTRIWSGACLMLVVGVNISMPVSLLGAGAGLQRYGLSGR